MGYAIRAGSIHLFARSRDCPRMATSLSKMSQNTTFPSRDGTSNSLFLFESCWSLLFAAKSSCTSRRLDIFRIGLECLVITCNVIAGPLRPRYWWRFWNKCTYMIVHVRTVESVGQIVEECWKQQRGHCDCTKERCVELNPCFSRMYSRANPFFIALARFSCSSWDCYGCLSFTLGCFATFASWT